MKVMTCLGGNCEHKEGERISLKVPRVLGICTCLVEVKHGPFESRCLSFNRPLILPDRIPITTYFHCLLIVGGIGSERRNFCGVCRLCYTFASNLDITSVGARVFPCETILWDEVSIMILQNLKLIIAHLGILGQAEELPALMTERALDPLVSHGGIMSREKDLLECMFHNS